MMGFNGGWGMMGGLGYFGAITALVILVDLILLGVWLWQKINRK